MKLISDLKEPRILGISNQKGGVGKTTTAINLGTALAAIGERVMVIDLDPQGNASTGLGIESDAREWSSCDVLLGYTSIRQAKIPTFIPNLSIVPSTLDLLGFETEVSQNPNKAFLLRNAIQDFHASRAVDQDIEYTYFILDCPPALNLITMNAMAAANAILVPLQCEFLALEGLGQTLRTVEQARKDLNPELYLHGIVLTMYDKRNKLAGQVVEDVRQVMGDKVYTTIIPRNVRISEAPSHGKPVLLYDHKCSGSVAYLKLASEIIQRERLFNAQYKTPQEATAKDG